MTARPPRVLEWILSAVLDASAREAVAGDLAEEYVQVRRARGALRAQLWYLRSAVASVVACRLAGRRRVDHRRLDYEPGVPASLRDLLVPAVRQFRDRPLYALAVTGTLAAALGAATASVAIVKRALLDPLPYAQSDTLVSVLTENEGPFSAVSPHVLDDLRASGPPLTELAPIRPGSVTYTGPEGVERVGANRVTPSYFSLLGVTPAVGRVWTGTEPEAVVISWQFWQNALEGAPDAIGRSVRFDGTSHTVVGVLPAHFVPPYWPATSVWLPLAMAGLLADERGSRTLSILARRADYASPAELGLFMARFSDDLRRRYPLVHARQSWVARPLRDELVGDVKPALLVTAAGAALLLLIVGANIAGLSTAQAIAMRQQLAIRAALGASRFRLFVEQLVDGLLLAGVGSAAGLWLASALVAVAARYQRQFLDRLPPIVLDGPTMAAAMAAGVAVAVIAALLPRRAIDAAAPLELLRGPRTTSGDRRATMMRAGLVALQVALALVLVVQSTLLVRTVRHLTELPLGFEPRGLSTFSVTLPHDRYETAVAQIRFEREVLDRLQQMPGVAAASASIGVPVIGGMGTAMAIRQRPDAGPYEIAHFSVSPEFLSSIGARLIAGRGLTKADDRGSPRVILINDTMARTYWPDGTALGAEVQLGAGTPDRTWFIVVGIVADLRQHGPTEPVRPTAFGSTLQQSWPLRNFVVRTHEGGRLGLAAQIRAAVGTVDPAIAVGALTPFEQLVSDRTARYRLSTAAVSMFGTVAVVLCLCGLYAIVALTSRLRRREYAIRLALGANRRGVGWMVVRQGLGVALAGIAIGLAVVAMTTRLVDGVLHGVHAGDGATVAIVAGLLVIFALLAAWQPAHRAGRVDPVETLRAE